MKRFVWILALMCIASAGAYDAGEVVPKNAKVYTPFPFKYPLWLARILAPLGVAEAQALVGTGMLENDRCKGANLLQSAAKQHQLFAEKQLLGYYHLTGLRAQDEERLKKALLWWLHFESHFPEEEDQSSAIVRMLKLTPEQERSVRERFKTWNPEDESPPESASCAGQSFSYQDDP